MRLSLLSEAAPGFAFIGASYFLSNRGVPLVNRDPKTAEEIAALINDSLRAVPELGSIEIVVIRLSEPDADGCNWVARQVNTQVKASPEFRRLIEDIIRNAQRRFNLFELH